MSKFDEMLKADLDSCSHFGGVVGHKKGDLYEEIEFISFDESSDMLYDSDINTSHTNANIPAFCFATTKARDISTKSFIIYGTRSFVPIQIEIKKDGTTIVFCEEL